MYLNDVDLIKQQLQADSAVTDSAIIRDIIRSDTVSLIKNNMNLGQQYYISNNSEIMSRLFTYMKDGRRIADEYRSNNKVPSGFLKLLIDQKVDYSLSKPVIIENAENTTNEIDINSFIHDIGLQASKKAVGWLYINYDTNGELITKVINSEEIIPIYDTQYQDELVQVIRYYAIQVLENGTLQQRYKVEVWDSEKVSYYSEDSGGNYLLESSMLINPAFHWVVTTLEMGIPVETIGNSWGKVPFIPLWNNPDHLTDLSPVKAHIDLMDKTISDFGNNMDDIQDSIIKLINYGGMKQQDLSELLEYLKMYKILPLDDKGDAEFMKNEIPVEARKLIVEMLRNNIFEFGQGVDVSKVGDGNITNIVIKSRYALLDLKANGFERKVTEFIKNVLWFVNKHLELKGMQTDDLKKVNVVYNRSIIVNNTEVVKMGTDSKGLISDETILKNHPWVNDFEEELKKVQEEKLANMETFGLNPVANNPSANNDQFGNTKKVGGTDGNSES